MKAKAEGKKKEEGKEKSRNGNYSARSIPPDLMCKGWRSERPSSQAILACYLLV